MNGVWCLVCCKRCGSGSIPLNVIIAVWGLTLTVAIGILVIAGVAAAI